MPRQVMLEMDRAQSRLKRLPGHSIATVPEGSTGMEADVCNGGAAVEGLKCKHANKDQEWGIRTIYIALLHQLEHPEAQHGRQSGGHDRIPPHALRPAAGRCGSLRFGPCSFRDL